MQRLILNGALTLLLPILGCTGEPICHGGCGEDGHGSEDVGESGSDDTDSDGTDTDGTDTGDGDMAGDLCACLLFRCHVSFHDRWGVEDGVATAACKEEMEALPKAGMDVDSGDFIECRVHYCEMSENDDPEADDPDFCPQAMGETVCQ
jgi:hypothetical protein